MRETECVIWSEGSVRTSAPEIDEFHFATERSTWSIHLTILPSHLDEHPTSPAQHSTQGKVVAEGHCGKSGRVQTHKVMRP